MSPFRRGSTVPILLLAACGGAQASKLARAHVDTLPNGTLRVMSDGPTAWGDSSGASLVEVGRFQGEDGTPAELGEPRSLAVDAQGRIYVVDSKPAAIKVFTPDGKLVRSIGREGEGPGEFRVGFIAVRDDHLVLHDPRLSRTSVWDTAGNFIRSWHSACCYWTDIQIDRNELIYVPSPGSPKDKESQSRGTPYVRWTMEGVSKDTVWVPKGETEKYWRVTTGGTGGSKGKMMMVTTIPFMPTQIHALHPDGGLVYAWTGSYSIVRSITGGDSARVFGRAWTPEPLTNAQRRAEVESRIKQAGENWGDATRNAFKLEDVPAKLPAFLNLRVDPSGRVWARRFSVADSTKTRFDVFDSTGAYLGPITVPFKLKEWGNQVWTRDGLVTIIEDEEGRPTVIRLKIGVPENP
jgi:6-bladed beta-propeller protein